MISKLFYKIAKFAVGKLAQNPELQVKTASFVKERVVPVAKAGWEKAKPKLEQARDTAIRAAKDPLMGLGRMIQKTYEKISI